MKTPIPFNLGVYGKSIFGRAFLKPNPELGPVIMEPHGIGDRTHGTLWGVGRGFSGAHAKSMGDCKVPVFLGGKGGRWDNSGTDIGTGPVYNGFLCGIGRIIGGAVL